MEKNHFSYEIYNKKDTLKQMSNLNVNLEKASRKWGKLIESFGVTEKSKIEWMSEYATYHNANESVAYAQGVNVSGMGGVISPIASNIPGQTIGGYSAGDAFGNGGAIGSGDLGQSLIPAAMKIAAQTIGLDLVAVKPSAGPVIDLVFVDYRYDDGALSTTPTYIPVIFQLTPGDADAQLVLDRTSTAIRTFMKDNQIFEIQGGLSQRLFMNLNMSTTVTVSTATLEPSVKTDVIEFLGFSRIDGNPMFRAFRQANTAGQFNHFAFDAALNTFPSTGSMASAIDSIGGDAVSALTIELISALEDHIPGFTSNFTAAAAG